MQIGSTSIRCSPQAKVIAITIGVPYALVIAIASGMREIIPILGPWAAAGIAMLVVLFQPEVFFGFSNLGLAGVLAVIYFALRQVEDHVIIPNLMGSLVRLYPAVVIFAILAGGVLAGVFGLLISIPIAAVTRILLAYVYRKVVDSPELHRRHLMPKLVIHPYPKSAMPVHMHHQAKINV